MSKKNHNTYKITIDEPCTKDWSAMLPDERGKFCQSCQKSVIDFTGMSDNQIIAILEKQEGPLCGRLKRSQQNRELIVAPAKPGFYVKPMQYAAALLLAGLSQVAVAHEKLITPTVYVPEQRDANPEAQKPAADSNGHYITGKVLDPDKDGIPGAVIRIEGTDIETVSDVDGMYRLFVPAAVSGSSGEITLVIKTMGAADKKVQVNVFKQRKPIRTTIEDANATFLGGISYYKNGLGGNSGSPLI